MFRRVQTESLLSVVAANSGLYTCMGCNGECVMNQTKLFVTTLPDGFHVQGPSKVSRLLTNQNTMNIDNVAGCGRRCRGVGVCCQ